MTGILGPIEKCHLKDSWLQKFCRNLKRGGGEERGPLGPASKSAHALLLPVYRQIPWHQGTRDHFIRINARHGSLQRMEDDASGASWTANHWAGQSNSTE